jgi:hypothetical protein
MTKPEKPFQRGKKNAENNNKRKQKLNGKTAKEIVKRHLSDKDDKITNEDFENFKN